MYQITILYTLKFYVNVNNISIKLENKKELLARACWSYTFPLRWFLKIVSDPEKMKLLLI